MTTTDDSRAAPTTDDPRKLALVPSNSLESMIELREELAELARALPGDLRRIRVRGGDREIEVEWADQVAAPESGADQGRATPHGGMGFPTAAESPPIVGEKLAAVRAPLVGCYYAAPSPGAEPFVQVGDAVEVGTTVAIIEAMKLMNTIVAGESGVVTEVLVTDGESVEYDQILLHLRPKEQAA
jgi:acetyl-CoA carboxylase biotin carboxyl carrier protein